MTLLELKRTFWYAVKAIKEGQYHRAEAAYWDVCNEYRREVRDEKAKAKRASKAQSGRKARSDLQQGRDT